MPFTTFVPPKTPVIDGAQIDTEARTRDAKFGDGYEQSVPDGINSISDSTTLFWRALTIAQAYQIDQFFRGLKGSTPFIYHVPGQSTAKQWKCKKWSTPLSDGVLLQMSAALTQDFSISP